MAAGDLYCGFVGRRGTATRRRVRRAPYYGGAVRGDEAGALLLATTPDRPSASAGTNRHRSVGGYASLRSQSAPSIYKTTPDVSSNARQAALRAAPCHQSDARQRMGGVGSTVTGSLSPTQSYWVNYLAGDSRLLPGHPIRSPSAVTIDSTGVDQDRPIRGSSARIACRR